MEQTHFNRNSITNNSGSTHSLWMEVNLPSFPALESNAQADVCIVGAGIAGLTCAYTLAKQGKSVIILDQGPVGGGQTARTTAHLSWILGDRYYKLEKIYGEEGAKLIVGSHASAIDYIEKIVIEENIDCDFERVDGYLFASPQDSQHNLDKEYIAIQKTNHEIHKAPRAPFSASYDTGACLRIPNQAQFHILKYLQGLIKAILKYGGQIYAGTHVNHFYEGPPCEVNTQSGIKITSQSIIVATCSPINNRFYIHTKQAAYRTYVIAASLPKGAVPKGLYWDTEDPYHYIRVQKHLTNNNLEWLIVGGEDHRTGQDSHGEDHYDNLEKWIRERITFVDNIEFRWSGQVFEPVDSIAFIGRNPGNSNVYVATGDAGNGITHGTIAGILIPDLILGKSNLWKELYAPSRKTLSAAPEFINETLNTLKQYEDWFTSGEIKQLDKLSINEGIILRKGIKKIAVYKDQDHHIHVNSAFCPHLGGCIRWNSGEKSWDCPCHGSRFDGCGRVMNGPAINNLYPSDESVS